MFDSLNASRLYPALLHGLSTHRIALTAPGGGGKSTFLQLFAAYTQGDYQAVYFPADGASGDLSAALLCQLDDLDIDKPRQMRITAVLKRYPRLLLLIDDLEHVEHARRRFFLAELLSHWHVPQVIAATPDFAGQLRGAVRFPLRYHDSRTLAGLVEHPDPAYIQTWVELLDYNPGQLRQRWQQAHLYLSRLHSAQHSVQGFVHQPSLGLMLKWLLVREHLGENPYAYLSLEKNGGATLRQILPTLPPLQQAFLLSDLSVHHFEYPRVLSLYIEASGDSPPRSALVISARRLQGQTVFAHWDLSCVDFSAENLSGLHFRACDFSFADLRGADLRHTVFDGCELHGARFDAADVTETRWQACQHLESLCTDVVTYQRIANQALASWQAQPDWPPEALYKMYKTMFNRLAENDPQRPLIMEKGVQVRRLVQG